MTGAEVDGSDAAADEGEGEGEGEVAEFDPEHDAAMSPQRRHIKDTYERALGRGDEAFAERLRRASSQHQQLQIAGQAREFDPAHDDTSSSSTVTVARTWRKLREAGHDEAAEDLRYSDTLREQRRLAREYRAEYGLEEG